jgi:Fe-S cluster assembly iron-binding protein IscA
MITITPAASARLSALISHEPDADRLGIRLVVTTTGCGSYAYSIAITEPSPDESTMTISGIMLCYKEADRPILEGCIVDLNPHTGRLQVFHPHPPASPCPIPQGVHKEE